MVVNILGIVDDARCYETLRRLRWPEGVRCPHCDSPHVVKQGRDETQGNRILSHYWNSAFSRYSALAAHFSLFVSIPRRQLVSRLSRPKANRPITLKFVRA
jgi:Transposase zinc-ribbon domain